VRKPPDRPPVINALVLGLVFMIVWKYIAPIHWYLAESFAGNTPDSIPIDWDFWPLAHAWVAWLLWTRSSIAWHAGVVVAALEVLVVTVKFAGFFLNPEFDFWRLMWFTNKVYVLAFFLVMLVVLSSYRVRVMLLFDKT